MKNKAVFLDRDGTLNWVHEKYYISNPDDLKLNEGVIEGLSLLRDCGFIFIVISNQSGIAKKLYSIADAENVNTFMCNLFLAEKIKIEEVYFCPHHPEFDGKCLCRKPDSLLVEKAISRFNIDASQSYFIGDAERDITAGKKAGLKGIKIQQNENIYPFCQKIVKGEL
ncbi:MAG: hypothetical protein A2275_15270 [Bacteroidetes bacterium RIFOXYA12_FULL_35_11]|nr:MAG: hypothetical protein A2X01_08090 [Bacteroidetes bacterium GWF2_35_48]OFY83297.1 MAG: hypothetical protein A2275_15270 [Bacteroidetes bacterium RIFOXYA12_FULL_35_11]OFY93101.1 MAG: hypothetical protein A2491_03520 [Bacteroidetes bacterium RIFOXYC12_FULL_35_7]OFY96612.1 MAG: hypothetical protein A2309_04605 [Bacteroidetes bacterium RIFOXYB2_FULL_35_7]HBX52653.1 HAD family hydrolase [Bacteroidales bacterium]